MTGISNMETVHVQSALLSRRRMLTSAALQRTQLGTQAASTINQPPPLMQSLLVTFTGWFICLFVRWQSQAIWRSTSARVQMVCCHQLWSSLSWEPVDGLTSTARQSITPLVFRLDGRFPSAQLNRLLWQQCANLPVLARPQAYMLTAASLAVEIQPPISFICTGQHV